MVNARSLADWGQVPMFLLKKAKVLFAFLVTASTWVFQERFLEMLRPRYFWMIKHRQNLVIVKFVKKIHSCDTITSKFTCFDRILYSKCK